MFEDRVPDGLKALAAPERYCFGALVSRGLRAGRNVDKRLSYLGEDGTSLLLCAQTYALAAFIAGTTGTVPLLGFQRSAPAIVTALYASAGALFLLSFARICAAYRTGKRWRNRDT